MSLIVGDLVIADAVVLHVTPAPTIGLALDAPVALAVTPPAALVIVSAEQGPPGRDGQTATVQTYPITAASSFNAVHGFPYAPRVTLLDATGTLVETDVSYAPGHVTLTFPAPFTGTLYLG